MGNCGVVGGGREGMARGEEQGTEHPTEAGDTSLRRQQHMKVWDIRPQVPDANKDGGKNWQGTNPRLGFAGGRGMERCERQHVMARSWSLECLRKETKAVEGKLSGVRELRL